MQGSLPIQGAYAWVYAPPLHTPSVVTFSVLGYDCHLCLHPDHIQMQTPALWNTLLPRAQPSHTAGVGSHQLVTFVMAYAPARGSSGRLEVTNICNGYKQTASSGASAPRRSLRGPQ